jgi:hypothetical protein
MKQQRQDETLKMNIDKESSVVLEMFILDKFFAPADEDCYNLCHMIY